MKPGVKATGSKAELNIWTTNAKEHALRSWLCAVGVLSVVRAKKLSLYKGYTVCGIPLKCQSCEN